MLTKVKDQIREYQAEYIVSQFENIITHKKKDVEDELISNMLTDHTAKFFKPLQKLDTWLELNVLNHEEHNNIPSVFEHLKYQLDKYFGNIIGKLIDFWFFNQRVPHDWEAQLTCFGMEDLNLVTGYYHGDLKTYLSKVSEFSEFINIVDYTVRNSIYKLIPKSIEKHYLHNFTEIYDFLNLRQDSMGNFSQFFEDWKIFYRKFVTYTYFWFIRNYCPDLTEIKNELVTLLENEYQSKFINAIFDHELPNLWRGVSQQF
jgi:hypothetical protein